MNKKKKQIRFLTAYYRARGENFALPTVCQICHKKGLLLTYNYEKQRMEAVCSARGDAIGRYVKGCEKVSFVRPMTEEQYHIIVDDPHTSDYFFYLKVQPAH